MLFDLLLPIWSVPGILVVALVTRLLFNRYGYGISSIPGPVLASFTDLWRFFLVWYRRPELTHIELHKRCGPLVRLGPNSILVSDPEAIKVIYGLGAGYLKSGFYPVQQPVTREGHFLQGMFNTTDEAYHAKLRRAVSSAYAMSTLVQFEPFVDSTTTALLAQLTERYADRQDSICDFGEWLQLYAFDVIGELTFSKRLGFVDQGVDIENIISNNEWLLGYFSVIGQIPSLDRLLLKNPVRLWLSRRGWINATSPVASFAKTRMQQRLDGTDNDAGQDHRRDFLSRFLEAGQKDPGFMDQGRVLSLTAANMFAGSDTTAISLRAIFYHLLKTPDTMQSLRTELDDAERKGLFSRTDKLVKWQEANQLPYLAAVIKEALRIHPAAGLPLERIVPPGGVSLAGRYIPAGTIVGCSAWTIHRSEKIFGHDTDKFRPNRWLESPDRAAEMNQFLFTFGAGARTCVGKNISFLEMYKLVPAVLRTFEIKLADPDLEWELENKWFVKQSGFLVRLVTRTDKIER